MLSLDLVGVQEKRYAKDAAARWPDVQEFGGAWNGAETSGGIFWTTGRISAGPHE